MPPRVQLQGPYRERDHEREELYASAVVASVGLVIFLVLYGVASW